MTGVPAIATTSEGISAQPAPVPVAEKSQPTTAERIASIKEKLDNPDAESASEPTGDASSSPAPAADASPVDSDTERATRAQQRLERIQKLRETEAEKVKERREKQHQTAAQREIEKLRNRVSELEPMEQAWSSPMAMLEWAEKKGLKAPDVVQVLREKLTDPAAVAASQARSVKDEMQIELAKLREELRASEERRHQEIEQAREQASAEHRALSFVNAVSEKSQEYPLTAAFAKAKGAHTLIALANKWVAPELPRDYTLDQLHDHMEQMFEELQLSSPAPQAPATEVKKRNGIAKPATTLSNAVAAGRETLVEETPLHRLPKAERVARLRAKLGSE